MTHLNCRCQTRKQELTSNTWRRRYILRLWLHPAFSSSGFLFYLCVCVHVCVAAVALPPEKTDSCCTEEKTHERDSQSPAGPQKQLQFEVSVNAEQDVYCLSCGWNWASGRTHTLPHVHTHTYTQYDDANSWRFFVFQELECAVSVEEDNRQEWTFTLYDFDNNGKVTREVMILWISEWIFASVVFDLSHHILTSKNIPFYEV